MYSLIKSKAYTKAERKYLSEIGKPALEQMEAQLKESPRFKPGRIKKMVGAENTYRYRIGDYRVVYEVLDEEVEILLMTLKPRGEAYK